MFRALPDVKVPPFRDSAGPVERKVWAAPKVMVPLLKLRLPVPVKLVPLLRLRLLVVIREAPLAMS